VPNTLIPRIFDAAQVIRPVFRNTPHIASEPLDAALRARVTLKVETLGPIRSFKGRGADYLVSRHARHEPARGLVCASAGNFGQGLAFAGRAHHVPVTVFAALNANPLKVERMRALGADVHLKGRDFDEAKQHARAHAEQHGLRYVEDGHDEDVTVGAGTIAVELLQDPEPFDAVVVPVGNGALIGGVGAYLKAVSPATRVIGVCAEGAPSMYRSWLDGRPTPTPDVNTIADGIAVREPIPSALDLMARVVDDVVLVTDAHLVRAMREALLTLGLLVEPAGVAGLAALLALPGRFENLRVATVLCGGNVTDAQVRAFLASSPATSDVRPQEDA